MGAQDGSGFAHRPCRVQSIAFLDTPFFYSLHKCSAQPLMHLSLSKHLVIKHTFLEFQSIDEDDSPKLRRHKSDPLLACARQFEQVVPCGTLTCKFEEPLTPTTCASSVTGEEEDVDATPSSPYSIDEDEASSQEGKFSFS